MCLIIHKPTAELVIPDTYLDNAEQINPDGFGIVYTDTNECVRTMDYNYARELILAERPFVAHYRYATRGVINKQSCHPYHVANYMRLFSNGTVANLGDKQTCDTAVVAENLKRIPSKYWSDLLSMTETRFAITHPDGTVQRHGIWHEKDGVYYSKNNCFYTRKSYIGYHYGDPYSSRSASTHADAWADDWDDYGVENTLSPNDTDEDDYSVYDWQGVELVAVYGTLKAGKANHRLMQGIDTEYVGAGLTVNKYAMQNHGVPYVFKHRSRDQIAVEVYRVPEELDRADIDALEGHPTHYKRELIDVELLDGSTVTAWLYFGHDTYYDPHMTHIQNY